MSTVGNQSPNYIVVGKLGKPFGIKGFISVHSYLENRDDLLNYANWYILEKHRWEPLKRLEHMVTPKGVFVTLSGHETREDVAKLTNAEIGILRTELPLLDADEYYWDDLIGLTVKNLNQVTLGEVDSLLATGSNDVLIVCGDKRHLIPYLQDDVIKKVDLSAGEIIVDWED